MDRERGKNPSQNRDPEGQKPKQAPGSKVIDTFQARRRVGKALDHLAQVELEPNLLAQVRQIATHYEPQVVIPELIKRLGTNSSQLRGGLGRLAALLPSEQIVPALRNAAANRANSPAVRLTATLILERFLGEEVPGALLSDITNPEDVVMQSLREAIDEGRRNPRVLLEYVRQMRQEDVGVAFMVLDLLGKIDPAERVELLRLIAYDPRPQVASAAIQQLERIRQGEAAQQAARALHVLRVDLPPALAQKAERSWRKLRFAGVLYTPPQPQGWRALLGAVLPSGDQEIWFLQQSEGQGQIPWQGIFINVRINVLTGLEKSFGDLQVPVYHFPIPRDRGEMLSITGPFETNVYLEASFDDARGRLKSHLAQHHAGKPRPLPEEYTLFSPYLWEYAPPPELDPEMVAFLASGPALWAEVNAEILEMASGDLLQHPAMHLWFFRDPRLMAWARDVWGHREPYRAEPIAREMLQELFASRDAAALLTQLEASLQGQAEWFAMAKGGKGHARQALLLAEGLRRLPPVEHPLLLGMMVRGVRWALQEAEERKDDPASGFKRGRQ